MSTISFLIGLGVGVVIAAAAAWWLCRNITSRVRAEADRDLAALRERTASLDAQLAEVRAAVASRDAQLAALQEETRTLSAREAGLQATLAKEREISKEKLAILDQAHIKLSDTFKALSADALRNNNQSFLELARSTLATAQEQARGDLSKRQQAIDELVRPVRESLEKFDSHVKEIEQSRTEAYARLTEQVTSLRSTQEMLQKETGHLARALGAPQSRGRWGELTLRRVVELAGMQKYCDFDEQVTLPGEARNLRPDLIVRLPGGRCVAVDAKAPLNAYLEALNTTDDATRRTRMTEHARAIRDHVKALAAKSYWERLHPAPEFVVLFLPGEPFFAAALDADPTLIEAGVENRVVLAPPTTLIALLKAISYGWRQEALAENAQKVSDLGRELYKRLADMTGHFEDLGEKLGKATESYNKAMASLETRVLVSARRFEDLQVAAPDKPLDMPAPIEVTPRKT